MKIGFLTNCLATREIGEIAGWAKIKGFDALEIGPHIPLNAKEFIQIKEKTRVDIFALIYCRNFQSSNSIERQEYYNNLIERIEFASKTEIKYVSTSTGIDETKSLEENVEVFREFFTPIIEKAKGLKVIISFENCPGMGNIAISPYIWRQIFEVIPLDNLKLTFDPSHLVWQGIDCYRALEEFVDKVAYIHIKDTEIVTDVLKNRGILYGEHFGQNIWWRHRLPGWGEIDWKKIITILINGGFDGVLSIEHEDQLWMGNEKKIKAGLLKAKDFIETLI